MSRTRTIVYVSACTTALLSIAGAPRESRTGWQVEYAPYRMEPYEMAISDGPLKCELPACDFGEIWAGEDLYHEFRIENTGGEPLWIEFFELFHPPWSLAPSRYFKIPAHSCRTLVGHIRTDGYHGKVTLPWLIKVVDAPEERVCPRCGLTPQYHTPTRCAWLSEKVAH